MRLLIQINCLNEEGTLETTVKDLPAEIPGIEEIAVLIVDDGSTDDTVQVAKDLGIKHIVSHPQNLGLPSAVNSGMDYAVNHGFDILVNTDADNQYPGREIRKLVEPIVKNQADIVYGERKIREIEHFSSLKKFLQLFGAKVVSGVAKERLDDAASGFRALNPKAFCSLYLLSEFASPLEAVIQAKMKKLAFTKVSVDVNGDLRPSRIVKSIRKYVFRSATIILDNIIIYRPLQIFFLLGLLFSSAGFVSLTYRYWQVVNNSPSDHLTLLGGGLVFFILGFQLIFFGLSARLGRANKIISEQIYFQANLRKWQAARKNME
jgi:glycosyltransferase involved in cell wall biosynthesis